MDIGILLMIMYPLMFEADYVIVYSFMMSC